MKKITKKEITILAIESSCDETAAAILVGNPKSKTPEFKILSSVVKSQIQIHKKSGGVIPEVAARAHVKNILPVTHKALKDAKLDLEDIDYFAVTSGPGLIVSLVIGVEFSKTLALTTGKKMIPVNHMAGHLYSPFAPTTKKPIPPLTPPSKGGELTIPPLLKKERQGEVKFPILSLIVSGGHTLLVVMTDYKNYKVVGSTVDDAVGEAFDKVARLLGLPYPGGPEISKLAENSNPSVSGQIVFPRPMINHKNFDFSFSGLKTSVRNYIENLEASQIRSKNKKEYGSSLSRTEKMDIAKAFQDAAVDVLIQKTLRASKQYKCKTISLSGGVAANRKLREDLAKMCAENNLALHIPEFELCTDNAQMIAIAAYFKLKNGFKPVAFNEVRANPNWEL